MKPRNGLYHAGCSCSWSKVCIMIYRTNEYSRRKTLPNYEGKPLTSMKQSLIGESRSTILSLGRPKSIHSKTYQITWLWANSRKLHASSKNRWSHYSKAQWKSSYKRMNLNYCFIIGNMLYLVACTRSDMISQACAMASLSYAQSTRSFDSQNQYLDSTSDFKRMVSDTFNIRNWLSIK